MKVDLKLMLQDWGRFDDLFDYSFSRIPDPCYQTAEQSLVRSLRELRCRKGLDELERHAIDIIIEATQRNPDAH